MGIGPVAAANKALLKAGLTMQQMDVTELNEAFAAQALACTRVWGLADDDVRLNPNGDAIARGIRWECWARVCYKRLPSNCVASKSATRWLPCALGLRGGYCAGVAGEI